MTTYIVNLTVGLTHVITDEQARDVVTRWADALQLDLPMTSIARDEPWLHVSAAVQLDTEADALGRNAAGQLRDELHRVGHQVERWHAIEVLTDEENTRRGALRGIPPLTDAQGFADLLGVKRQRIYQLLAERRAGKRGDFPLPVIEGYWLTSEAAHHARTRRTKPGPPARSAR